MDLRLKVILFTRLILAENPAANVQEYIQLEVTEGSGEVTSYTWVHPTMDEPDQAALDAEDLIYQEEMVILRLMPLVSKLAKRLIPSLEANAHWFSGDYEDLKWSDDLLNESNANRRLDIDGKVSSLTSIKIARETEKSDLETEKADLEANENPTVAQLDRINQLSQLIPNIEVIIGQIDQEISDLNAEKDLLIDVAIEAKPTLQELKDELVVYEAEVAAAKVQYDTEVAELAAMDIFKVLKSLLGHDPNYISKPHYEDIVVFVDEKPTWQEVKDEWEVLRPALEAEAQRAAKKGGGKVVRTICEEILDLIAGNNLEKSLTIEQIDQMEVDYAEIFQALKNFRPDKAKALLLTLTPDGTLFTSEDKDEYLAEFAKYGL